jgi:hypothetical protein
MPERDVTRGRAMSENEAQGLDPEAERPDRRTGTRIARALWLPAILTLTATLGYTGVSMWAGDLDGVSGLPFGRAVAGDEGGAARYVTASRASVTSGEALVSLGVAVSEGPGWVKVEVYGAPVPVPKPRLGGREPSRLAPWQGQHRGRDA